MKAIIYTLIVGVIYSFSLNAQQVNGQFKDSVYFSLEVALDNPKDVYKLNLKHQKINPEQIDLSAFVNLNYLILSYDSLLSLPKGLDKLSNLKTLDISGNNFTLLPSQLTLIPNLEELYLNNVKHLNLDQTFNVINRITHLKRLHLDSIPNFKLPKTIEENTSIEYISMRYDDLNTIPKQINSFKHLKELNIEGNSIRVIHKYLLKNKELESLSLSISPNFNFKKSFLILSKELSLQKLEIANSSFETLPDDISLLDNITTLSLRNDHLKTFPYGVLDMKNLRNLDISGNDFTALPANFINLKKIETLNLTNENLLNFDQTADILKQLPSLHLLKIGDYDYTFDDGSYLDFTKDKNYIELLSKNKTNSRVHLFKSLRPAYTSTNMIPLNNFNAEGFGVRLGW
jgi:Leucine-rich repeat (LRR) protein